MVLNDGYEYHKKLRKSGTEKLHYYCTWNWNSKGNCKAKVIVLKGRILEPVNQNNRHNHPPDNVKIINRIITNNIYYRTQKEKEKKSDAIQTEKALIKDCSNKIVCELLPKLSWNKQHETYQLKWPESKIDKLCHTAYSEVPWELVLSADERANSSDDKSALCTDCGELISSKPHNMLLHKKTCGVDYPVSNPRQKI